MSETVTAFIIDFVYHYRRAFPEFDARICETLQMGPLEAGWSQVCNTRYMRWRVIGKLEGEAALRSLTGLMEAHGFQRMAMNHPSIEHGHPHPDQHEFHVELIPFMTGTVNPDHPEHPRHSVDEENVAASVKNALHRIKSKVPKP